MRTIVERNSLGRAPLLRLRVFDVCFHFLYLTAWSGVSVLEYPGRRAGQPMEELVGMKVAQQ